jgi:hypothetical protein
VIKYCGFLLLFQIQVNRLFTWYYGGQKILTVSFCHFKKKKKCKPYFIVIMIIVLIIIGTFWVVNFKTRNYFVIFYYTDVYLRLSMYDCSNFVHSCRIFGISELYTVQIDCQNNNMHVKMTRIESRVTVPNGLFTLYMNVKIMTAKIFSPP